jgi:hypothetical protein
MDGLVCVHDMRQLVLLLLAGLEACGDNIALHPDASGPAAFESAPHVPMPLMLPHAGTVLTTVGLVTLTFDGYPDRTAVEAFGAAVFDSTWFADVCAEYGVVGGRQLRAGSLGPAPTSLARTDLPGLIASAMARGLAPLPGDPDVLYLIYAPPSVARGADVARAKSFHDTVIVHGTHAAVAVVFDDGVGLGATTTTAARALVDAATNPYAPPSDGFYADPPVSDPWSLVRGEISDLCAGEPPVIEAGWTLPRVYSNRAATSGYSPCAPQSTDEAWTNVTAEPSQLRTAPRGSAIMYTLTGWSTAPVADWRIRIEAAERSNLSIGQMRPLLSGDTINNNTQVTLTLQVPKGIVSGTFGGVVVESGPSAHPWVVGFIVE